MKITATKKFQEAMNYAMEQKQNHLSQMSALVYKLCEAIPKEAMTDEVMQALDDLNKEFNQYEAHPYNSFQDCIMRILSFEINSQMQDEDNYYVIGSEYGEHCLSFGEHRADGRQGLCGGIIFHGFPDTGYMQNGSVQLTAGYGWATHT